MHVYMHPRITLHSSWDIMHAFSFDLRSSRKQSSLTAGELKENLIEEIKAIYREVNPEKADIPQLLEYYNGQELELYKRVCEKYNVQPKERYGSILTSRRRRRQRSQSDERPQPMASRPPMTPGSGVAPVDSDAGDRGADAGETGVAGVVPEAEPKNEAADDAEGEAEGEAEAVPVPEPPAVKADVRRPESPPLPPKRIGIIPAFRPTTQTGRYWPCPSPHNKFVPPTAKMAKKVIPPPPKPLAAPLPWWPPTPPPPAPAKKASPSSPAGTTSLPPKPKAMPKEPRASVIHAFMHAIHVIHQSHARVM